MEIVAHVTSFINTQQYSSHEVSITFSHFYHALYINITNYIQDKFSIVIILK